MVIDNKFELGDVVYIKTDKDQLIRQVTGIMAIPGAIKYLLSCGNVADWFYEMEISVTRDVLITSNS